MSKEYRKEVELKIRTVINLWEEQPLINDDQIEELINLYYDICQLQPKNQVVIAEGKLDNIKWESPYNKLVFYFKDLPKRIGIKIIKNRKVKIILESEK